MKLIILGFTILAFCINSAKEADAAARGQDLLYRAKCAACHKVYPPRKYTYQKLQVYVTRYGKGLTDEERQRLLEYLKENAKQERGEEVGMGDN